MELKDIKEAHITYQGKKTEFVQGIFVGGFYEKSTYHDYWNRV